jgi:hypothetical protein
MLCQWFDGKGGIPAYSLSMIVVFSVVAVKGGRAR